ncbi:hypothetical protein MVEN_02202400 [Mycena venus]|uniref:Uncharacterized protein n=1 Tax=Mycena venus TaxID=2733690 RepID=A0A8H6X775_9AGAR|nr:hypothetical protein MVEN_02202400 [Mycena venus]
MGPSRTFCASAVSSNRGSRLSSMTCVQSASREECFCVANTTHDAFAHRKMRNRLTLGLRRKQRRKRVETVVSYLDIEEAQYNAELEKYNMGHIDGDVIQPTLRDLAKAPGIQWDELVSDISEGVALMSLWDGLS